MAGASTVLRAAPVVRASILNDLESLSAGMAGNALLRSEHASTRPSNDSSGDSGPHRRSKRFLSYPRFVEVMVVADSKMVEHHGSNLQHYILTLMSIVSIWFWLGNRSAHANVSASTHIDADECTSSTLLFVLQVSKAFEQVWGRERAAQGRGKQLFQETIGKRRTFFGRFCLTALMNVQKLAQVCHKDHILPDTSNTGFEGSGAGSPQRKAKRTYVLFVQKVYIFLKGLKVKTVIFLSGVFNYDLNIFI